MASEILIGHASKEEATGLGQVVHHPLLRHLVEVREMPATVVEASVGVFVGVPRRLNHTVRG
jgi:hypothetical protein